MESMEQTSCRDCHVGYGCAYHQAGAPETFGPGLGRRKRDRLAAVSTSLLAEHILATVLFPCTFK